MQHTLLQLRFILDQINLVQIVTPYFSKNNFNIPLQVTPIYPYLFSDYNFVCIA